ncbi:hypothetical protein [Streptomyces sp. NPDC007883]|uniref:hypothetical protein n=1 Tax=Streptomyces sp. NPDC007883 TaxID=3155116 RepID=UPI0033E49331
MLCTSITDARIVTMDPARPLARELDIRRGRVVGLYEDVACRERVPSRDRVLAGAGRGRGSGCRCPGAVAPRRA